MCAQSIVGNVPEVDRVTVRVAINSYQFAVASGQKLGSVNFSIRLGISAHEPPRRTPSASLVCHSMPSPSGAAKPQLLMDFGFTAEALNNNLDLFAIDLPR